MQDCNLHESMTNFEKLCQHKSSQKESKTAKPQKFPSVKSFFL